MVFGTDGKLSALADTMNVSGPHNVLCPILGDFKPDNICYSFPAE
jgi:hypothetical protein